MSGRLRLGLVGCGRIAERGYLPALRTVDTGFQLTSVADTDAGRAESLAQEFGGRVEAFSDPGAMIGSGRIDALVIATTAATHVELAALAGRAGLPCLVEKPPSTDLEGARRLAAISPRPAIGFNRRFLQGAELHGRVPGDGWLALRLELRFRREAWGAHTARDDALLDAGLHMIDLAGALTGSRPIAVRGARLAPEAATFELELGRGRARIACASDRRYAELVEVRDRAESLLASHRLGGLRSRFRAMRGADPLVVSLGRQLRAFAAAVRGEGGGALAGADAGVASMAVAEAARRSAELDGAEITVSTPGVTNAVTEAR